MTQQVSELNKGKTMATVGLFFGSDTGNTEAVAKMIQKKLGKKNEISKMTKMEIYNITLLISAIYTYIIIYLIIHIINYSINKITKYNNKK